MMRNLGFTQLSDQEVLDYFIKSRKKNNPRKKGKGIEMGWVYKDGPLTLFVWVSFVPKDNVFKERDHLWIVIEDDRTEDLYYLPLRRTKTLFDRAKPVIAAHKDLMDHWPTILKGKIEEKQFLFFEPEKNGAKMYKFRQLKSHKRTGNPSIAITEINTKGLSETAKVILVAPFIRSRMYCERNIINNTPRVPMAYIMWRADHGYPPVQRPKEGVDRQPNYTGLDGPHSYSGKNPYPNG